jgi:hypothetical protein
MGYLTVCSAPERRRTALPEMYVLHEGRLHSRARKPLVSSRGSTAPPLDRHALSVTACGGGCGARVREQSDAKAAGEVLLYEYKLRVSAAQQAAIAEAIRIAQFIRNKCLRLWMDEWGHRRQ